MNERTEKHTPTDRLAYIVTFTLMGCSAVFGFAYFLTGYFGLSTNTAALSSIAYVVLGFIVMAIFAVGGRHELSDPADA